MRSIFISLSILIDSDDHFFFHEISEPSNSPPQKIHQYWEDFVDVDTKVIHQPKTTAKAIPLPTCKLLGG